YERRAIWEGWVIVEVGNTGGAQGLADLKTALRFLRYDTNASDIPGNKDMIFALGGDYALLLGATGNNTAYNPLLNNNGAADTSDSVFAAAACNPSVNQKYVALGSSMFESFVKPSALRQLQKEFATGGYAAANTYSNLPASTTVTFNNNDNLESATNVASVKFSESSYQAWAGTALTSNAAPDALLEYNDSDGDLAPNWWIRSGAKNAYANAAILKLANDLKGEVDLVNARLVWDDAVDVFGFFDFAHYILAKVFTNPGTSSGNYDPKNELGIDWYNFRPFVGLDGVNTWLPARTEADAGQAIPGVTPTTSYPNYPIITAPVPHTIRESIPYVAYESVPVPYKTDTTYKSFGNFQRLDIYRAIGTEDEIQPVIIYVHGGGGTGGDKRGPSNEWIGPGNPLALYGSRDQKMARSGLAYGYTVVEINYRINRSAANGLSQIPGRNRNDAFPYPETGTIDARAAIRWLKDNAEMIGIDPDQIILAGASAGGNVVDRAALLGSNPAKYNQHNTQFAEIGAAQVNDDLAAVVSIMTTGGSTTVSQVGAHAFTPPYYFFAGERDSTGNWRTNSLIIYNAIMSANPSPVVRLDVIEGGGHETGAGSLANQYNIYSMYKWLADQGFSVADPDAIHPLQGPTNIAFSFPSYFENISTPAMAASAGINVAAPVKVLDNNLGLRLTIGVTGAIASGDSALVAITNMDQILADAGIRPGQLFTIRQANPANVDTRYTLVSLSDINDYMIPLRNGSSTVTISLYEAGLASGNARLTIIINSNITVYAPITFLKIADEDGNALPAMTTVSRNTVLRIGAKVNDGATSMGLVWTVSDPSFAIIDTNGRVIILNKIGIVVLTAKDHSSGITHSIVLRIS
ncbi:MAG: carboxylesterase family protein, partial [Oscillospiraceae bacterium]|nr:carboxylesterase family protein [Oscillospiraceae bacterium]